MQMLLQKVLSKKTWKKMIFSCHLEGGTLEKNDF